MGGITVTVVVEPPGATPSEATVVAEIRRDAPLCAATIGLSLAEAKDPARGRPAPVDPGAARRGEHQDPGGQ